MTAVAAPGLSGGGGGGGGGLGNNNGMNTVGSNVMIDLTSHSVAASTSSAALTLRQRDARRELELAKQNAHKEIQLRVAATLRADELQRELQQHTEREAQRRVAHATLQQLTEQLEDVRRESMQHAAALYAAVEAAEQQRLSLEHEKEFCYTEIDRLEQEVAHRQAMLSTQVESLGQAQEQRHHLEQRLAQITQQKREATDEVAQLQAQQRDATAALQRHEAASRAANEARAKREESDRRANDERAAHLARVTAASDAAVARLERDVAEARRAANERRGQCETLTAQLSELKRTHNDAEHEVRQLQQRVEELQATALESRAAADDAEALNEALRADMDALRNRTAAAERRAHRAESACDQLRDRLAAISTASSLDSSNSAGAATTPGRVAALRERLRDTETDRDALRQRCELAEQRIAELESHRSLKAESAMQAKLLAAQQRCEALQIRNDTLTRERDELQRQLTNSAAAVAATAAPAARARQRVAAAVAAAANTSFSPQPQPRSAPTAYVHQKSRTDDNDADDHHLGTNGTSTPDEIEQHVQAMLREHAAHDIGSQLPANFHRIAPGVYQFGTRKVYLQLRNGALMARVGGGFVKLLDFIDRHGPQERIRLRRLASQFGDALSSTVAAPTPAPAPATATPSSTTAYYSGTSPTLAAVHSSYAAARAAKSPPTQTPLMAAESVSNMHSKPSPKWSRM